jgi:hypothetical protein
MMERLHEVMPSRRGRLLRLADWFKSSETGERLPDNPRLERSPPPPRNP